MEGEQGSSKGNHVASMYDKRFDGNNFPFSQEECKELVELLNKNKAAKVNHAGNVSNYDELSGKAFSNTQNGKKNVWILDSGASDHIVYAPSLLTSLKPVYNRFVKLPDGTTAQVTHIGKVVFTPHFILHNVLCVPFFYLNLISLSKLALDSFYITIFLRHFCFIQDLRSGEMIGTGSEREDLYCLNPI